MNWQRFPMYKATFKKSVLKKSAKLPTQDAINIFNTITEFLSDPSATKFDTKKLTDFEGYRLRVGDYRIIYTIDHKAQNIDIKNITHRKDAY